MTKIRIDTERVRDVGRRFSSEGDHIDQINHELQQAIGNLDTWAWDGRSRAKAEPMLDQVRPESVRAANGLDELSRKLMLVAETFEQKDGNAAQNLGGMPWVDFETKVSDTAAFAPKSDIKSDEKSFLERAGKVVEGGGEIGGWIGTGFDFAAAAFTVRGLLSVKHVSGFSGNVLKDAWVLGGKNIGRTWRDMAKTPVDDLFEVTDDFAEEADDLLGSAALVVGSVCEVVSETGENWQEYKGDPGKIAGGILFDSALGVSGSLVGGAVGTFALGAVGGAVFGPPGAVIGGKVGGFVGGWLGGEAAEWLENRKIGGRELDKIVADTVDRGIDAIVDGVASLF
jgi:WXG100 family type VII secretion target